MTGGGAVAATDREQAFSSDVSETFARRAARAGGIYDQFALVIESLDEVGRNLERARESFDTTHKRLRTGRGNLVRRVQQLQELGARTKKTLPQSVLESDENVASIELLGKAEKDDTSEDTLTIEDTLATTDTQET